MSIASLILVACAVLTMLLPLPSFAADHVLRPLLIGGSARLPFIWILLGIFGGTSAFGLVGLFIGPAIVAAIIALWRDLATPRSL